MQLILAEANLSYQEAHNQVNGKFNILDSSTTHQNLLGAPERASIDVAINLEPKKYYIFSATPVGDFQTAFVVQMIDGL